MRTLVVALRMALVGMPSANAAWAHAVGIPPAYSPVVIEPSRAVADRFEFDLSAAFARAAREKKRLYVYLAAHDCPYCRRYEAFLDNNAAELVPHIKPYLVVDLRSALSTTAQQLYIRVGDKSLAYADF